MTCWQAVLVLSAVCYAVSRRTSTINEEKRAQALFQALDREYAEKKHQEALTSYFYNIDVSDQNVKKMIAAVVDSSWFLAEVRHKLNSFDWRNFKNKTLKRLFHKTNNIGSAILPEDKFASYSSLLVTLKKQYASASVCRYDSEETNCNMHLPAITNIMSTSRDVDELQYYWVAWRNASGPPVTEEIHQLFEINNEIAALFNYSNAAEMWIGEYDSPTFENDILNIWSQIKPLYTQLHAYVRRKLRKTYGGKLVTEEGTIPAHLLGNLWAQKWPIYGLTAPFPLKTYPNITDLLIKRNYSVRCMADAAEEFFKSLNLSSLSPKFWKKSILEKPLDREISCQPSAWDLFTGRDYRVTAADFLTLHHELAHIHYFMEYKNQPTIYHEGANPGFHEAIGDMVILSAMTPSHLQNIGLLSNYTEDNQATINFLFHTALQKIVQLPYALVMDLYRWNVFKGLYTLDKYNCEWWAMREKFQGVSAPVKRLETDCDLASKYHIIANRPYISYFVSTIQQFQLYRSMCVKADLYDPSNPMDAKKRLHNCDFSQSQKVGQELKQLMSLGSSVPWQEVLESFTGERRLSAVPLLEYFRPLQLYLQRENRKTGEYVGWRETRFSKQATPHRPLYTFLKIPILRSSYLSQSSNNGMRNKKLELI